MKPASVVLIALLLLGPGMMVPAEPPALTIGLLSKIIADVSKMAVGKAWLPAKKGDTLSSGDRVKTGAKSVAIIKFLDNSLVRVRELSEVVVTGSLKGSEFSKSIDVRMGVIGFSVEKQRSGEEFRFTSPTSVASIRGTGGAFNSTAGGDTLIILEGTVHFTNNPSNRSLDVAAGFTGISQPNGTLFSRQSTPRERLSAQNALSGDAQKTLEFELRDRDGNPRNLRIEYHD
jgi:hypothetical protein